MKKNNLICIIQARLNSARYPKKIFSKIFDKTLLEIIYSRLKNQFKIIEEELFITNKNFRDKMRLINSKIEKGEIKG